VIPFETKASFSTSGKRSYIWNFKTQISTYPGIGKHCLKNNGKN